MVKYWIFLSQIWCNQIQVVVGSPLNPQYLQYLLEQIIIGEATL